jgi:hypothetical protein
VEFYADPENNDWRLEEGSMEVSHWETTRSLGQYARSFTVNMGL